MYMDYKHYRVTHHKHEKAPSNLVPHDTALPHVREASLMCHPDWDLNHFHSWKSTRLSPYSFKIR